MSGVVMKRAPGTLAERFWSLARVAGPVDEDATSPEPKAVVRHVLRILDALSAGEVGEGLSQSTLSFLTLLRQQEAAGDLSYASPEQARGETLDERSLVFSVGVLLFEELTGRHPFGAMASGRRLARIQKCELGSGVQYFPQVPSQLRNVLMKAMGPFPEERYASLRDLREHLERFVEDRPDQTPSRRPKPLRGLPPSPADILFGSVEDSIPTKIHRRADLPTAPAAARPADAKLTRTDEVPALSEPTRRLSPILERLAWLGLGAGGALAITLLLVPGVRHAQSTAPKAIAVSPVAAQPVAVAPSAAAPASPSAPRVTHLPVAAAPAPVAPARGLEPPPVPQLATAAAAFDLEVAGRHALDNVRPCFAGSSHTVRFGAGLLFAKTDAVAHKTYLSPDEPLTPDQRECVKGALLETSAGAAPEHNTVIDLRFAVRPGDPAASEVKASPAK